MPANLVWGSSLTNYGGVSISGSEPTNDCFVAQGIYTYGCAVSADTNYIVFGNNAAANWVLVRLTNGVPDSSTIQKITASNSGHRSIAFDAANNVYTVDGNSDSLRVYSLGQSTTCYTYNDATGT